MAQTVQNPPAVQETWVRSLGWEDPLEEGMATHSGLLLLFFFFFLNCVVFFYYYYYFYFTILYWFAWRIPIGRGAWWAAVHGVAKRLDTYIVVYVCQSQSPNLSLPPYPLVTISSFSISVTLFLFGR